MIIHSQLVLCSIGTLFRSLLSRQTNVWLEDQLNGKDGFVSPAPALLVSGQFCPQVFTAQSGFKRDWTSFDVDHVHAVTEFVS